MVGTSNQSDPEMAIESVKHSLVGGLEQEFYDIPIILGISTSQLTFTPSFFRGVGRPATSSENSKIV